MCEFLCEKCKIFDVDKGVGKVQWIVMLCGGVVSCWKSSLNSLYHVLLPLTYQNCSPFTTVLINFLIRWGGGEAFLSIVQYRQSWNNWLLYYCTEMWTKKKESITVTAQTGQCFSSTFLTESFIRYNISVCSSRCQEPTSGYFFCMQFISVLDKLILSIFL